MILEKNVANLLIVRNVAATGVAGTEGTNVSAVIPNMVTGESVCVTPAGLVVDGSTATIAALPTEFKIGTKLSSGKILWSDLIKARSIKSINTKRYAAATLQTDYVGYNGVSGSIDAINSNIYTLRLYLLPLDLAGFAQQKVKRGVYKSDTTASQQEIVVGIADNLIKSLSKEAEKIKFGTDNIKVECINSGALANALGTATAALTKGSQYVVFSEDMTTLVTAGTILRFGATGAGTAPCYVVESADAGAAAARIYKLSLPYQGTTTSALAAASVESVTEGNWGIKLTGVKFSFDAPKFGYLLPRWKTTLQDFGTTLVTESAISAEGTGEYEWVAQTEQQLQGSEGNWYRAQVPYPTYRQEAVLAGTYALVTIEFEDSMSTTLGSVANSPKQLWIACAKGNAATYTDAQTGLGLILTSYITAYGIPASAANVATEINA
jgi:hypothetical protein